jgi:O-antigen/teichoic acid export membrane protein
MSRLSKNILYNLLGQGLLLLLGFVAVRFVFRRLGADALGIIYFAASLSALLSSVLEMGISSTTTREVAAHYENEPGYIRQLIRTATSFYWVAYLLLAVAVYWGAPWLVNRWIHLTTMDKLAAIRMIRILGIATLTTLPRGLYASLLRGLQRMEFPNLIDVGTSGLQQFGTVVILALGGSLFDVVHWIAASLATGLFGALVVCGRFFPLRALVPGYSRAAVQRNLRYSSHMAFTSILIMMHLQADRAIVSKLLPIGVFGYYALASGAVGRASLVTAAVALAAFPSFAALFKVGNRAALLSQYRKLQDLLLFVTAPVFAALPFAALPLFTYLLNAEAARGLLLPVVWLSLATYMSATLHIPYFFCLAVGKPGIAARTNLYGLFTVLPAAALAVYFFGLAGAGLSLVVYHLFWYAYGVPRICSQCLGLATSEWFSHLLNVFALAGLTYGPALAICLGTGLRSVLPLMIAYAGASTAFLIGAYWLIGDELRVKFLRSLEALRARKAEVV